MSKNLLKAVFLASAFFAGSATQAKADDWGCTIFVCFAAPTDPMGIPTCASAILKIRPWKKPTCSSARMTRDKIVTRNCPSGYMYERDFRDIEDFQRTDDYRRNRVNGGMCISSRGELAPAGEYTYWDLKFDFGDNNEYEIMHQID